MSVCFNEGGVALIFVLIVTGVRPERVSLTEGGVVSESVCSSKGSVPSVSDCFSKRGVA